ncbi:ubiquitin carboxyl-terminal hydrolase 14-like [Rhododendron vialii]|uniref:ubiquitin carboxyl-terminal hydrolase 14-like n=1 Tax=Rhododendron vialii TaxID=182163 RepID=UPI0026605788|nr:ubiquitin carboxyl-terminal hydrolase 14-like [Rhododendron vialii]
MANISFPISLWLFILLICPAVAFASLIEEDFTFADNANHNIDKRGVLLPHADYRIREDVASRQDEESYHTSPLYFRKLKEMKEVGLGFLEREGGYPKRYDDSRLWLYDYIEYLLALIFKGLLSCNLQAVTGYLDWPDAFHFFVRVMNEVERVNASDPEFDPSTSLEQVNAGNPEWDPPMSFKFGIEERLMFPSGKVSYQKRDEYILSLSIPLDKAINKEELESFHKSKAEDTQGNEVSTEEIVRPRVRLVDCLRSFLAAEEVHDFDSNTATATKTAGLTSFPDYLVLHMQKNVVAAGWVPKKLDVCIDVPDTIDISFMRSKCIQPGEELLPEPAAEGVADPRLLVDGDIVSQIVSKAFEDLSSTGREMALSHFLSEIDDADNIDAQSRVDFLVECGFQDDIPPEAITSIGDSGGAYRLMGIVSRSGTSAQYVAHIKTDGLWVTFNDEVGVSKDIGDIFVSIFDRKGYYELCADLFS